MRAAILSSYFLIFSLVASQPLLCATQQRDQDEPVRLKTDLVSVATSVIDRNGRAIKSLKAEDFTVYEDGIRQKISHFATTEEPFTLLLLLDTSGSTREETGLIK